MLLYKLFQSCPTDFSRRKFDEFLKISQIFFPGLNLIKLVTPSIVHKLKVDYFTTETAFSVIKLLMPVGCVLLNVSWVDDMKSNSDEIAITV